jgi:hypothetical protein
MRASLSDIAGLANVWENEPLHVDRWSSRSCATPPLKSDDCVRGYEEHQPPLLLRLLYCFSPAAPPLVRLVYCPARMH